MSGTGPPTEQAAELAGWARGFLERDVPLERVRELAYGDYGFDGGLWRELSAAIAELGWFGLTIPAEHGGSELSAQELAGVFEGLGRALFPGPLLGAAVASAILAEDPAFADELRSAAAGSCLPTVAWLETTSRGPRELHCRAQRRSGKWLVRGGKTLVPSIELASHVVVVADAGDGPVAFLAETAADGIEVTQRSAADATRSLSAVVFDGVAARRIDADQQTLHRAFDLGALLVAVEALGGATVVHELATQYAKDRKQFGRSIGSFQAVSHILAEGYLKLTLARGLVEQAAAALDAGPSSRAVSMAKAYTSDAYVAIAGDAIQIQGGNGFTWENDTHLFYRRAITARAIFGGPEWHRQQVVALG